MKTDEVKLLVRGLYDVQKLRIQLQLRIERLVRDEIATKEQAEAFFKVPFEHFTTAEKHMEKQVWQLVKDMPIVKDWLHYVKGIGPRLSGLLVANIYPIERFETPSRLWAYAGMHVIDGRAVKRKLGEKANWNAELRETVWKIGCSFVKTDGAYRKIYDRYKARITERELQRGTLRWEDTEEGPQLVGVNPKEMCPGRINNMAIRYVGKLLLSHLWQVWREMEGLPCRPIYCTAYLNHMTHLNPWDFIEKPRHKQRQKQRAG